MNHDSHVSLVFPAVSTAPPESCPTCLFPQEQCLCGQFSEVRTRTEFIVVRHVTERRRRSNTGRAAANLMPNARLLDYGQLHAPPMAGEDALALPDRDTYLLWPEGPVVEPPWTGPTPRHLIVLDGTWQQARRMRARIAGLRGIPPLHVAPLGDRQRLRITPAAGGVSTLEAIAAAVELFEGEGAAAPLLACYDRMVEVLHTRGRSPRRRY